MTSRKYYNKTCGILLSFVRRKKFRSIILTLGVNELHFDSQHIFMVWLKKRQIFFLNSKTLNKLIIRFKQCVWDKFDDNYSNISLELSLFD